EGVRISGADLSFNASENEINGIEVYGCFFLDPVSGGVSVTGGLEVNELPDPEEYRASNVRIKRNWCTRGNRNSISLTSGVRDFSITDNLGLNTRYHFIRAYRQVSSGEIKNNLQINYVSQLDVDTYKDSNQTQLSRSGIRIGDPERAIGTVSNITASNNNLFWIGSRAEILEKYSSSARGF